MNYKPSIGGCGGRVGIGSRTQPSFLHLEGKQRIQTFLYNNQEILVSNSISVSDLGVENTE